MNLPQSQPPEPSVTTAAILALVSKGLSPREIVEIFPELTLDDVRSAVLQTAELMRDPEASLAPAADSATSILRRAQRNAGLSEAEAMELAIEETRAHRQKKVSQR